MKALSLWQPWGSLWARGRKANETRHWPIDYRGPLLIHAAKKLCVDVDPKLAEILADEFGGHWARELPRGALIGICDLISCTPTERMHVDADENAQGNYAPGRFAWGCQNARLFAEPIPYKGMQGLFTVPDYVVLEVLGDRITATVPPQGRLL